MFTRRFAASMVGTTLTAATLGLAALGFAGTASASSTDEAFLAQLQADGITPPSAARAIKDAHAVCDALDEGEILVRNWAASATHVRAVFRRHRT